MSTIPTGTYEIEQAHSSVGFVVRHAGISKVRGHFDDYSGTITVAEPFADSSVQVTIASGSVKTGQEGRDQHLSSPDFWDAASKPTWTFSSTSVQGEGEEFVVHGDLTINGVTNNVALETEFNGAGPGPDGSERVGFSAEVEISRKDFDLTWNAVLEGGGVMVSDKVRIQLEIEAVKQA